MANFAAEDSEEFGGKLIMMGAQVRCPSHSVLHFFVSTLSDFVIFVYIAAFSVCYVHFCSFEETLHGPKEGQSKGRLEREIKQARAELFDACNMAKVALNQRNQAEQKVVELKKATYGDVYQKVFD